MDKRHKDIMSALVGKLRHILVGTPTDNDFKPGDLDRELERLGIDREGNIIPIDALSDIHNGDGQIYRVVATQLNRLPERERAAARREIVERAAYTWINRLLALRAMEARGLIDDILRISEDYGELSEKLYLLRLESPESSTEADGGWWTVLKDACAEMSKALPGLFALNDPHTTLHPTANALVQCIAVINGKQPLISNLRVQELDATFADPDAIGWAYQFYQSEGKAEIDAKCKVGGKAASRAELAAKTQLFTEPYMVQWLLQNSLGRSYVEFFPKSSLPEGWSYYIQPDENSTQPEKIFLLEELTLLDPCMGSGHFLRVAFDMFVAMYQEQYPQWSVVEIVDRVLSHHLYGIDLDPRAAQLSALTLYLRAWEMVKAEHQSGDASLYIPPTMHLATTPTNLDAGALDRHIQRYPEDIVYKSLLEKVFEGLEQAETLGSLLRSREYLDQAIANLQNPHTVEMGFTQAEMDLRRDITIMANINPGQLRQTLLDRIAASFHAEANRTDDVSMILFGHEAEYGVRLLQVLDRQYAVVATNPPYLGNNYMGKLLKDHVKIHYPSGRRDLYTTFIVRCLELCKPSGRVAMVTMHTWMFLHNFTELRAVTDKKLSLEQKKGAFLGILRETSVESLAHLGPHSFEEISGEVVQSNMHIIRKSVPKLDNYINSFSLIKLISPQENANALQTNKYNQNIIFRVAQSTLLRITDAVISVYHLPQVLLDLLCKGETINKLGHVGWGVSTCNNDRFLRLWWETPFASSRWLPHVKGGGYSKWEGFDFWAVEWRYSGIAIKISILERFPYLKNNYEIKIRDYTLNKVGWTFSSMSGKGLAVRKLYAHQITNAASPAIFLQEERPYIGGFLNSIIYTFILRGLTTKLNVDEGYVASLPIKEDNYYLINKLVELSVFLKKEVLKAVIIERQYIHKEALKNLEIKNVLLHTMESIINRIVADSFNFSKRNIHQILDETGTPAGWYPLITCYDSLPDLSDDMEDLPELPQELYDYLNRHERIVPDAQELLQIKAKLKALYEAGPGAKEKEAELAEGNESSPDEESEDEETVAGAYISIPTETFLEDLSVKMHLHPISVYWLLEELRAIEMVRCLPEERRLLEDRLSVLALRLLRHRWPKQTEAFEPVPDWAEPDGIIPLVSGTGHKTLAERVRERLHAEEEALGAQKVEALLQELTGQNLEQWLRVTFFERHSSQFKKRPVAWHLSSTPPKRGPEEKKKRHESRSTRTPAFECLLYYHACSGDALARIRTQYVEPLLQSERGKIDTDTLFTEDVTSALAQERIYELEDFVTRLRTIEEKGFACRELQEITAEEELDRWSGDGYQRPENKEAFQHGEEAWHVDINDGVRVNISPLQLANVLSREVLNPKDAKKALGDRVRWRADERRWVRGGNLPRCGWMDEMIPASQAWEDRDSQPTSDNQQSQMMLLQDTIDQDQKEVRS